MVACEARSEAGGWCGSWLFRSGGLRFDATGGRARNVVVFVSWLAFSARMGFFVGFVDYDLRDTLELDADIEHTFHTSSLFINGQYREKANDLVHESDVCPRSCVLRVLQNVCEEGH